MIPVQDRKPRVFYGYDRISGRTEYADSGMVKAQLMQDQFPNSPDRFNVLYLVSSRIPYGAVQIASAARSKGVRLVWNQNGVGYPACYKDWQAVNAPLRELLHAADHVFYQSEFCRLSADRFLGVRKGPWEVLYNPVDISIFTPTAPPDPGQLVMLLGGSQYQAYRVATAINVLAEVMRFRPEASLYVTGRLSWSDEAQAARMALNWARERGVQDRVSFLGPYNQSEAPTIFRRAHVLLHTKYNDPCPGAVIEAMACGVPVVYSASGGVPELVGKDAGIGISVDLNWDRDIPPDARAMAEAVLEVARHRKEFSHAARQRAEEKFDSRPWIQRHQEVFEDLLQ
jgi:glycosyltransferase involved in cell wall biosynthesis